MPDSKYRWNPKSQSYLNSRGKPVDSKQVRGWIDETVSKAKEESRKVSRLFVDGKINQSEWYTRMDALIRRSHSGVAQIASGGKQQMTPQLLGRLGARVKSELAYLKQFSLDIENGKQKLTGVVDRASKYADSAVSTFERFRQAQMQAAGFKEAMRILHSKESCTDCPPLAGTWKPIAELVPIGGTACQSRCKCSVDYR